MSASANFVTPGQQRNLRACMVCSIVQLQSKFFNFGCPNCEDILHLAASSETIAECTSANFEGLITLVDPSSSWVAKWQRLEGYVPGVYAVKVQGILPEETIGSIEDQGVKYIPRDGSAADAEVEVADQ